MIVPIEELRKKDELGSQLVIMSQITQQNNRPMSVDP